MAEAAAGKRRVLFADAAHFARGAFLGYLWCLVRWVVPTGSGRQRYNVPGAVDAITHELVHTAFPTQPDDQHWIEEGLATYIEPIARVQAGELPAKQIWSDMLDGMPKGEPQPGDEGLDRTHTWGRTYWGGALFCLMADVQIRVATHNRKGLQDALRAIVAAGGTIDHDWPLTRSLQIGDTATGTRVLAEQYRSWSTSPVPVDLEKLWQQLGIQRSGEQVELSAVAPYANIREAITKARPLSR